MITEEEKQEIVALAAEKAMLCLPEVVGNLIANHAALHKINTTFYKAHPEFLDKKDVVQSVVDMIEGTDPLLSYEEILDRAVPEIQKRAITMKSLDMSKADSRVSRDFSKVDLGGNGAL